MLSFRWLLPTLTHRSNLELDKPLLPFCEVMPVLFGQPLRFTAERVSVVYQSSPLGKVFDAIEAPYEFQKFDLQQSKPLDFSIRGSLFRRTLHRLADLSVRVVLGR